MQILLTNDDGIYAPGLNALKEVLQQYGDITVVAPATEQSGVSHSITYLSPIICREVYDGDVRRGWAVGGWWMRGRRKLKASKHLPTITPDP